MRKNYSAHAKTKAQISFAVTAKLISAFIFATRIVQFLFFLNQKFPVSGHLLYLYSPVCVEPDRKPHCCFSHDGAQMYLIMNNDLQFSLGSHGSENVGCSNITKCTVPSSNMSIQ